MNMEPMRFIAAALICLTVQYDIVFGEDQTSGRPDLTMYIEKNYNRVTCVAGTNSSGDALVLITPLSDKIYSQVCKYIYPTAMAESGCDFENNYCSDWATDRSNITKSGLHNFLPITDERWNLFPQFITTGLKTPEYSKMYTINTEDFHISVSVRSTRDVQFLLCDSSYFSPSNAKCYWIMIDAFNDEENKVTTLRKCVKGVPNDYPRNDTECSKRRKEKTLDEQLFKEMEWRHFTITRTNGKLLKLFELNDPNPLLEYEDSSPINISRLYFRGYNKAIAEWKIHEYNFLIITKPNQNQKLGPTINGGSSPNELCMSLYVALCPQCKLKITIASDNSDFAQTEIQGEEGIMVPWRNIKLRIKSYPNSIHTLHAYASSDQNAVNPFWAIDDVRRCHANEIRKITLHDSNVNNEAIACQSLVYRDWIVKDTKNNNADERLQCLNPLFTGPSCNITCTSLFLNEEYCNNKKICRPPSRSEQSCTCSSGATGSTCSEGCKNGRFGYNCEGICGQCADGMKCDKVTGNCENGCKKGYAPPQCLLTTLPMFLLPPSVIRISHTSAMLQLANITVSGQKEPSTYQMEFKEVAKLGWQAFGHLKVLELNSETEVTGFKPETSYLVRAVVYTATNESYKEDNIPTVKINTTCNVERDIDIRPSFRSVNLILQETEESCNIQNYCFTITCNRTIKYEGQFGNISINVNTLKPYTQYKVIIENNKYTYHKYNYFNTLEDAPEKIENLHLENASSYALQLVWDPPVVTNGQIRQYIVSYQRTKYVSCFEATTDYILYKTVTPSDNLRVMLQNLIPYSQYKVTIVAVTTLNGTEITQYYSTEQTAEIGDEELPNAVKVDPDATSIFVLWDLPLCSLIKGPLLYQITIKCLEDAWCPMESTIHTPVTSIARKVKIDELIPWTHYLIEFRATRLNSSSITTKSTSEKFQTKKAAPPPVQNLKVFSKTENSISIRWMTPYPPHGELELYQLRLCYSRYNFNCNGGNYKVIVPKRCQLWDEYLCFEIIHLNDKSHYNIFINAKNKEISTFGNVSYTFTTTIQEKSEKPWNLTTEWKDNKLFLYWNHPNITNGPLKRFDISLSQLDSEIIKEQTENVYKYQFFISEPLQHYSYSFNKSIPYSSLYQISIFGVNKYEGESEMKNVTTPPETPELNADLSVNENEKTNTTITIIIPGINLTTKSSTSFLYIIVSKTNTKHIEKRNTDENRNKEDILKFSENQGNAWIAVELEPSESKVLFVIGDNSIIHSKHLNENLINKPLEPESSYDITIVLMNQYKNQKRYKSYRLGVFITTATLTSGQNALYALLLLFLIVPVIVCFVYRKSISKTNMPRSIMLRLNLAQTETHREPDVIPLTQTSKDDARSRGSAIARKPSLKNKLVEAEKNYTATNMIHSRLVLLNNLEQYVKEALENGELTEQHSLFPRGQTKPWQYGVIKENKFKNRYNNLIAYDHTRVKLEIINNDQYSDYINANYISGYKQRKAYIATQGPKVTTVSDFWRMIWQEKVQYILMLANVIEGGKKKCEKYWPNIDTTEKHASIEVHFAKLEVYADYEFRTFEVKKKGKKRIVTQLHFTSWPDHGVPLYPQSLVPFLQKILTISQENAPIVVHCSAGVGRTGTIILCDICLRMAAGEAAIDVFRYLHEIREERANLVDNIDQYKLVHMVLLESLLAPNTTIPCNNEFSAAVENFIDEGGLETQLNYLQETAWQDKALTFSVIKAPDPVNNSKNRFENIVPLVNRIYISRYPIEDENSDYINAVPVDGFRFKEQFIVTQSPMPWTYNDFWRMIMEKEVKVIVSLNTIPLKDETCCTFWATNNEELAHLTITYQTLQSYDIYDIHSVILHNNTDDITSTVQIIQFKNWSHTEKVPNNIEDLVMLWEDAEKMSRGNYPMVVTCYDGATASGLFVALSFVIEKMKLEQQCDPCLAVRVIRRNRNQFVTDKSQFEFVYKAAVVYLRLFETYSNFLPVVNKSIDIDSKE